MGRHGAADTRRRPARVSIPLVVIAVLVLAAVGFGIWLWSLKSVTDPIDAKPVDAYAVVVSSPSCTSGGGTTVIDLTLTPVVRSSLSGCGQRVGARLAVQYLDGHRDQVRLAGTTTAHQSPAGRWLPEAIVAAGLLAVIATVVLLIERRQSRHAGAITRVTVAQLRAGLVVGADGSGAAGAAPEPSAFVDSLPGRAEPGAPVPAAPAAIESGEPADNPDVTSRIAMAGFAGASSNPFRASEIAVEEDLFTHRGPESADR